MKKILNESKNTCHVTFSLNHEANSVTILGDFTEWNPINVPNLEGNNFEVTLEIPIGRDYHFRYLINNDYWENDHDADAYAISPMYDNIHNSVLILSDYPPKEKKTVTTKKTAPTLRAITTKKAKMPKKPIVKSKNIEDDLTKIEGIGPKIAALLKADGIETFEKLSKSKMSSIQAILNKAGKRYAIHNPSTWAEQAEFASQGNWAGLKKWQDKLNGGKV